MKKSDLKGFLAKTKSLFNSGLPPKTGILDRFHKLSILALVCLSLSTIWMSYVAALPSPSRNSIVEPGSLVKDCRAIVTKDGSQAVDLDGFTGKNNLVTGTDAAVIQDAMDNILDSGRTNQEKVCVVGSFTIGTKLTVPSYTFLDLSQAKLTLGASVNDGMFSVTTKVYVTFYGGQIIGNRLGQASSTVPLIYMQGTGGIYQFYRIDTVKVTGCFNGCIQFDTVYKSWIVNSEVGDFYDTSNSGTLGALVKINNSNEIFMSADFIESSQDGGGLWFFTCGNCHLAGGSQINGNKQYGIQISGSSHDIQINGDEIVNNSQTGAGLYPDIDIFGGYHIAVVGNTMGGEAQTSLDRSGIRADAGTTNSTWADNIIFDTTNIPIDDSGARNSITGGTYFQRVAGVLTQVFFYATGTATISASTTVTVTNRMAKIPSVVFATPQSTGYGTFAVGTITATSFIITVTTSGTYTFSWMEQV